MSGRAASHPDLAVDAIGTFHMSMGSINRAGQDSWRPDNQSAGSSKTATDPQPLNYIPSHLERLRFSISTSISVNGILHLKFRLHAVTDRPLHGWRQPRKNKVRVTESHVTQTCALSPLVHMPTGKWYWLYAKKKLYDAVKRSNRNKTRNSRKTYFWPHEPQ
jgi:hypothetical protein